jgi:uncharacterized membrane protein YfcA
MLTPYAYAIMGIADIALLVLAGLAAGTVNAVAGGGSLITFPTLLVVGLPPVPANVTNAIAVFPGYLGSVLGSRQDLTGLQQQRRVRHLLPTAAVGGVIGCVLLLLAPSQVFEQIVPFLVLGATATLAFQNRLRRLVGHPQLASPRRATIALHLMVGLASIYGGYFGAALGVALVALLALVVDDSLAQISALKNVASAVVGLITVVVFALFGPVQWLAVAALAPATVVGGYVGARVARRLPQRLWRIFIIGFGTVIGLILLLN